MGNDLSARISELRDRQITKDCGLSYQTITWPVKPKESIEVFAQGMVWEYFGGLKGYLKKVSGSLLPLLLPMPEGDRSAVEDGLHCMLEYSSGYLKTDKVSLVEYLSEPERYANKAVFLCPWHVQEIAERLGTGFEELLSIRIPDLDRNFWEQSAGKSGKSGSQKVTDVLASIFTSLTDDYLKSDR